MESDDSFVKVLADGELDDGEGRVVFAGIKRVALFRLGDDYFCIQNHCPHAGGHLGLGEVRGHVVMCPRHSWGFDIRTGDCRTNKRYCAKTYETKVEDGWVWVAVPSDGNIV